MSKAFDFGANWKSFSSLALDEEKYADAETSLKELFGREHFIGQSFLDIGCGSGIFSVAAKKLGAQKVTGMDISSNSVEASKKNAQRFGLNENEYHFFKGDILKADILPRLGTHDLVYSWGCLHHTGQMWRAIDHTLVCVKPGGQLVLAIYNRHASSYFWNIIKKVYMHSPQSLKKALVWIFYGPIYVSKWFLTRQNPMQMKRGMDFYHDIVDWVGGYPYEYASAEKIIQYIEKRGFFLSKLWRTDLLVGNNQFLFERADA